MRLYVPLAAILCCILLSCHDTLGRLHHQEDLSLYDTKKGGDISKYAFQPTKRQIQQRNELIDRGIGSVIAGIFGGVSKVVKVIAKYAPLVVKISSHGMQVTSLILSLGNALTAGCMTHPNICTLKDQILVIERHTADLCAEIKLKYDPMKKDYKRTQSVAEKNIYLIRYIEGVLEDLEAVKSISEEVDETLSEKLNGASVNVTLTAEEYLNSVVRPNEYMLRNVQKFMDDTRKEALKAFGKNLAIQLGIQLLSVAVEGGIRKAVDRFKNTKVHNFQGSNSRFKVFGQRLKLAFKPKLKNPKFSPKKFAKNMKSKISKGFNGMIEKLKDPKGLVKSYATGIGKVQTFMNSVSIAVSAVMIYMDNKQWQEVENKLKDNLKKNRQYERDLEKEKEKLKGITKTMKGVLDDQVDKFKEIVKNFTDGFDKAISETNIIESFGESTNIPKEGVKLAKINDINRDNVLEKQTEVTNVVQNADFSLKKFRKFMEGFKVTLQIIKDGINNKQDLNKILLILKVSFRNNENLKDLTNTFTNINKVLCALANLLPDKTHFESVPLESIKEPCIQPDAVITTMAYKKERTAFGLKFIIVSTIEDARAKGNSDDLYDLAATVNRFINNDPLVTDAQEVKAASKQFMCMIADAMPNLHQYYYFDLSQVRGNACSEISDDKFLAMFTEADDTAYIWRKINRYKMAGLDPCRSRPVKNSGLIDC